MLYYWRITQATVEGREVIQALNSPPLLTPQGGGRRKTQKHILGKKCWGGGGHTERGK